MVTIELSKDEVKTLINALDDSIGLLESYNDGDPDVHKQDEDTIKELWYIIGKIEGSYITELTGKPVNPVTESTDGLDPDCLEII
jgi:hypothetical protein